MKIRNVLAGIGMGLVMAGGGLAIDVVNSPVNAPAEASTGAKITNWCMWTNRSISVQVPSGAWYTLGCGNSRSDVVRVKAIYPTRLSSAGICMRPGQFALFNPGSVNSAYTVPSC